MRNAFATLALALALAAGACIIADPATDLPKPPERRPTILRDRVVPPTTSVLGVFPDQFLIDVEVDPKQNFQWHLFVDYNLFTGDGLAGHDTVLPDPGASDGGVREIPLVATDLNTKPGLGQCHIIEALVAIGFQGPEGKAAHAFDSHGGDSVVWFYSPTGDLRGCPVLDAGVDGAFPDTGNDVLVTPDGANE